MLYIGIKALHVTCVTLTWLLFTLRGYWMITGSPRRHARWARIVPHVNDTLLLAAGLTMVALAGYSLTSGWLAAKLVGLLAYIVLGSIALKRGPTRAIRIGAFLAAQCVFFYIARVAVTHQVVPI